MKCPSCKSEIERDVYYCNKCGFMAPAAKYFANDRSFSNWRPKAAPVSAPAAQIEKRPSTAAVSPYVPPEIPNEVKRVNVYTAKNNRWEPFGYMNVDDGVIFDYSGYACFRYESGWLVSYKDRSLYRTDPDGRMIDVHGRVIGLIDSFRTLPADSGKMIYKESADILIYAVMPVLKGSDDEIVDSYFSCFGDDMDQAGRIAAKACFSNPDNPLYVVLYATHLCILADGAEGRECRMGDTTEKTLRRLSDAYNFISSHLNIPEYGSIMKTINDLIYYLIGEYYTCHNRMDEAERVLDNVQLDMFPYKAVLRGMIILSRMDQEYDRIGYYSDRWEREIREDIVLLKRALLSEHWFNEKQKSVVLTFIQIFTCGVYYNISEVEYSYYCLLYARILKEADIEAIDEELGKYRRNRAGQLVYDAG